MNAGMTLIEHYKERQMISELGKYTFHGSTKFYTNKLQKTQHIFEKYLECPYKVLYEVNIFGLVFEMQSQTNKYLWYIMSMESKQCDCAGTQSKCKHMLALKKYRGQKILQCTECYRRSYLLHTQCNLRGTTIQWRGNRDCRNPQDDQWWCWVL